MVNSFGIELNPGGEFFLLFGLFLRSPTRPLTEVPNICFSQCKALILDFIESTLWIPQYEPYTFRLLTALGVESTVSTRQIDINLQARQLYR